MTFIFSGSHQKFSLVLLQITNYIYSPWKMLKRMRYYLNYSGTRFFPLKNEITQFSDGFPHKFFLYVCTKFLSPYKIGCCHEISLLRNKHLGSFIWLGTISYSVKLVRMIFHVFLQSHAMPKRAGSSLFLQPMWCRWSGGLEFLTTNYFRIFHEMHPTKCFLSPFAALQGSRFTPSFNFVLTACILVT